MISMKYFILMLFVASIIFASPVLAGNTIIMNTNQYYDLEARLVSNSDTDAMDFKCVADHTIAPVHGARVIADYDNLSFSVNQQNLTNLLGHRWGTTGVNTWLSDSTKDVYIYLYGQNLTYYKIVSDTGTTNKCEFNNFTYTGGIFTQRPNSESSTSPFFGVYQDQLNYSTFDAFTFATNDTLSYVVSAEDVGIYFTNTSNDIPVGMSTYVNTYYSRGQQLNDSFYISGSNFPYSFVINGVPYYDVFFDCNEYRNVSINRTDVFTYQQDYLFSFQEPMCIYPTSNYIGQEIKNNRTYDYEYQINLENNTLLFHLNDLYDTFIESSNQTNNGICYNCPTITNGVFGNARQFNGTSADYISTNNNTYYNETLTLMAWVKLNNNPLYQDGSFQNDIIALDGSWFIGQRANTTGSTELVGCMFDDLAVLSCGYSWGFQIPNDTWTHVAVTFNQPMQRIRTYANGQLINEQATTMSQFAYSPTLITISDPYARSVEGDIDEVAVFSSELSPTQISKIYQKQSDEYLKLSGLTVGNIYYDVRTDLGSTTNVRKDFRVRLNYFNFTTYSYIYNVYHTPLVVNVGNKVTVHFSSSLEGNSTVYWRYRNSTSGNAEINYSSWFFNKNNALTTEHTVDINYSYILIGKTYQYYVESSGTINNNSGNYYSFTVGSYGLNTTIPDSTIGNAVDRLVESGVVPNTSAGLWLFGIIVTFIICIAGFYFGGVKLGIALLITCIILFSSVGLLPIYLLLPFIVLVAILIARFFVNAFSGD